MWDTIEDTHKCYNDAMTHILTNMKHEDMLFIASHNKDTCDIACEMS